MSALSWNHNASYHSLLLRRLPSGRERVLDVGCGTLPGSQVRRLLLRRYLLVRRKPADRPGTD